MAIEVLKNDETYIHGSHLWGAQTYILQEGKIKNQPSISFSSYFC
jgi:hypothetical protein